MITLSPTFVQHTWNATSPSDVATACRQAENIATDEAVSGPFSVTISRLMDLLDPHPEDEINGPSQHAFKSAVDIVAMAEKLIGHKSLRGSSSLDSKGGIRITWRVGDKEIRLICPATSDEPVYLYREHNDKSILDESVTPVLLARSLSWLSNRGTFTRT